ncbi:MAG: SCO4225 family membrane protein [Paracoccaceae bacterium]
MRGYSKRCLAGLGALFLLYVAAIVFAVVSSRGLFGLEANSLPVIWLILMGVPWTFLLAVLPETAVPEVLARIFVAAMPLLNIWLLSRSCRKRRRRRL